LRFVKFLKMYRPYLECYNISANRLNQLQKNEKFAKLLVEYKKNPECHQLDLQSFLIMPVQRVPRYSLLLRDIAKHTWSEHPDYNELNQAVKEVEQIATWLNDKKKEAEYSSKLFEITSVITKAPTSLNLMEPTRRFFRETQMPDHKTTIYLFNDMILTAEVKKNEKTSKIHGALPHHGDRSC